MHPWVTSLLASTGPLPTGVESRGRLAGRANVPSAWAQDPRVLLVAVVVSELISALCLVRLWRDDKTTTKAKLAWSAVLLVPFIGPLAYGAAR